MNTTTTEYELTVDVDGATINWQGQTFELEASDLRNGGWITTQEADENCGRNHCDAGDCPGCPYCDGDGNLPSGAEALKRWHDDQGHSGALHHCYEEPCKSVADALGAWGRPA